MTERISKGTLPYEKEQAVIKKLRKMTREIDLLRMTLDGWDIVEAREVAKAADYLANNSLAFKAELLN